MFLSKQKTESKTVLWFLNSKTAGESLATERSKHCSENLAEMTAE